MTIIKDEKIYRWLAVHADDEEGLERNLHRALDEGRIETRTYVVRLGDQLDHIEHDPSNRRFIFHALGNNEKNDATYAIEGDLDDAMMLDCAAADHGGYWCHADELVDGGLDELKSAAARLGLRIVLERDCVDGDRMVVFIRPA